MPNGKPGDHPITDIMVHGLRVYSPEVDDLVRRIVQLGGRSKLETMLCSEYSPSRDPDITRLRGELVRIRDQLSSESTERGWEVE